MAIEILPQQKKAVPKWIVLLLAICGVLIIGFGISYWYFYQSTGSMVQEIQNIEQALVKTSDEQALENAMLLRERRISDFARLLAAHQRPTNLLTLLEKITHPRVWFTDFKLTSDKRSLVLGGRAENFVALGQQIMLIKGQDSFQGFKLSKASLNEQGKIEFEFQILLDPKLLTQQQ